MQRKYSIGFFVLTLSIIILFSFAYRMTNQYVKNESKQKAQAKQQKNIDNCYYIKEKDGYVVVYKGDQETVYEYTSIAVKTLPPEIQNNLKKGIKVKSLSQIYGFLENYSS